MQPQKSRAAMIADALDQFINKWQDGHNVAANLSGAYDDLSACLAPVGIKYKDIQGSKAANPEVNGLHIGEILDMLHTLSTFAAKAGGTGFLPQKFWTKLLTMRDVMREADLSDSHSDDGSSTDT